VLQSFYENVGFQRVREVNLKLDKMFPSKYVTGEELAGKAYVVTIAGVSAEKMRPQAGSPEIEKYVLYTKEGRKGIVLSKTLAKQIAAVTQSDDTDHWTGNKIEIFAEAVNVAGRNMLTIRARVAQQNAGTNG
jgi:hypothetical protein